MDSVPSLADSVDSSDSVSTAPPVDAPLSKEEKEYLIGRGISGDYIGKRAERAARFARSQKKSITTVFLEWWKADGGKLGVVAPNTRLPVKPLAEYDEEEFLTFRLMQSLGEVSP